MHQNRSVQALSVKLICTNIIQQERRLAITTETTLRRLGSAAINRIVLDNSLL